MKSTGPLLIDTGRGFSILYNNRHLYSPTEPEERAIVRSNQALLQSDTLYILSSPLLFYGVKELLLRLPVNSYIICFEYSKLLLKLSKDHIPEYLLNSKVCTLIDTTDRQDIFNTIEILGIWNFRRVKALNFTGGYSLQSSEYKTILHKIDAKIQEYWKNRMTLIHMGPLWIRNIFLNLFKLNKNKLINYTYPHTKCPVIVTGAGESLENSISFIKKNRKFIKILAVDTSISVLVKNEIQPDYVIAVDAQIYNFYDFLDVKNREIPLFFDITGYNGIPAVLNGTIYPFISNFADTMLLKRLEQHDLLPERLPALGSVGLTAIYLALKITTNSIFYTGLDFAYKIGKSHANGSPRNISEMISTSRLNPMEQPEIYFARPLIKHKDKFGTNCITDLILASYAELMNDSFKDSMRLYDIGTAGLNSGGLLTETVTISFKNICQNDIITERRGNDNQLSRLSEFTRAEIKLLRNLYDSVFKYLSGEPINSNDILDLLSKTDYLYLHFPDKSPEPSLETGFLKRILVSCAYYMNILERYN